MEGSKKGKKDDNRFTIRFNPADPRQQKTKEVLNLAGRRCASLIAEAMCEYLARRGDVEALDIIAQLPILLTSATATTPLNTSSHATVQHDAPLPLPEPIIKAEEPAEITTNDSSDSNEGFNDEKLTAVLGGLSAFKM